MRIGTVCSVVMKGSASSRISQLALAVAVSTVNRVS